MKAFLTSLLFSSGYGRLSPRTALGKVVAVLYALVGVPLMLILLSALGAMLATGARKAYSKLCCHTDSGKKSPSVGYHKAPSSPSGKLYCKTHEGASSPRSPPYSPLCCRLRLDPDRLFPQHPQPRLQEQLPVRGARGDPQADGVGDGEGQPRQGPLQARPSQTNAGRHLPLSGAQSRNTDEELANHRVDVGRGRRRRRGRGRARVRQRPEAARQFLHFVKF